MKPSAQWPGNESMHNRPLTRTRPAHWESRTRTRTRRRFIERAPAPTPLPSLTPTPPPF